MDRDRLTAVALAGLAVLAFGAAAATLDVTSEPGGGIAGPGDEESVGAGGGDFSLGGFNTTTDADGGGIPRWVFQLVLSVVVLAGLAALYIYYREHGLAQLAKLAAGLVVLQVLLVLIIRGVPAFDLGLRNGTGLFGEGDISPPGGGAAGSGAEEGLRAVDPPTVLLALVGLVLLGAVVVVLRSTGDDHESALEPVEAGRPDVTAVGRAAGRAADRIDADAEVTNEVYRAWREMTEHLAVDNPDASTPAEFAAAAAEAGMDPADVDELTRLFEDVRYGDAPPTEDREARAVAALRRIEAAYAEGEPA